MNLRPFAYWINERHKIYLKKTQGMDPPWTEDPILREYKFTNVFRELDRVTQEMNERISRPYSNMKEEHIYEGIFDVIVFRMFNHSATFSHWVFNNKKMGEFKKALKIAKRQKQQIFTGAYIITNNGKKDDKIDLVVDALKKIKPKVKHLAMLMATPNQTLERTHEYVKTLPMCGPFVAYELVTDFRHRYLKDAPDIMTWANAGPGAIRGLNRIHRREVKKSLRQDIACKGMKDILKELTHSKYHNYLEWWVPQLEMRDVEHSLCEFDKYMRVKNGEGRPRSKYDYTRYQHSEQT